MTQTPSRTPLPRRRLLTAGGTVGALAATAAALPLLRPGDPTPTAQATETPATAAGYRLSAHVQRYYQTAKV